MQHATITYFLQTATLSSTVHVYNVQERFHETQLCPGAQMLAQALVGLTVTVSWRASIADRRGSGGEARESRGTDTRTASRHKRNEMVKKPSRSYIDVTVT